MNHKLELVNYVLPSTSQSKCEDQILSKKKIPTHRVFPHTVQECWVDTGEEEKDKRAQDKSHSLG